MQTALIHTSTTTSAAMSAIAAAVTPVVMISANAILIGAISAKHQAMSDRLRGLTAEWRTGNVTALRREAIQMQVRIFEDRVVWLGRAHMLLYGATALFIAMVLAIAMQFDFLSLPLLLCGMGVTLIAIVLELVDLGKARETLRIESRDVIGS
jgi:uncharacterized protein DUF2721